jgi:hypothetical protein
MAVNKRWTWLVAGEVKLWGQGNREDLLYVNLDFENGALALPDVTFNLVK